MYLTLVAVALCGGGPVRQCITAQVYNYQHPQATTGYTYNQVAHQQQYVDGVAFVAYDPYFSKLVGSQARQAAAAKADVDLGTQVGLLTAELGKLRQQLSTLTPSGSTPTSVAPLVPPTPAPLPPPVLPVSDLQKAATAVFAKKCASCHTDPAKSGNGFAILQANGGLSTFTPFQMLTLDQKCYSGEMPPDPKQALTAEEYSSIRAWINESKDTIETALKGTP